MQHQQPIGPPSRVNAATRYFRMPQAPADGQAFALVTDDPGAKPLAFASLRELAAGIHRRRGHDALQLQPEQVSFRDTVRDCVEIHAISHPGERRRLIGHAWIGGRDWRVLQAALEAQTPHRRVA